MPPYSDVISVQFLWQQAHVAFETSTTHQALVSCSTWAKGGSGIVAQACFTGAIVVK